MMAAKNLKPMEDPSLFEYEPKLLSGGEEEDEVHLTFYEMGLKPEDLPNPKYRKRYEKWLKKQKQ